MASNQVNQLIKTVPDFIISKVKSKFYFTLTIPEDSETYQAFEDWFFKNHGDKFDNVVLYNYAKDALGEKKRKNEAVNRNPYTGQREESDFGFGVGYSQVAGSVTIKYEAVRIKINKREESRGSSGGEGDMRSAMPAKRSYVLTGTNKLKIKKFVEEIYSQYNFDHDQIKVFVSDQYGSWNLVKRLKGKDLDAIVLNKDIHDRLTTDLEDFSEDRDWYESVGIPYKRGYLLYGPPGNGKTSLSIAIACKYKRNIYCLDVNKLNNDGSLRAAFQCLQANSLLLIEDVDATFKKREVVTMASSIPGRPGKPVHNVTFACLLNCLDGVYFKEGLITLMTTNIIGGLDQALIRPGRMDMKIFIDNPTQVEVETYLCKFFNAEVKLERYVLNVCMADVQGVCITHKRDMQAAIKELQADQLSVRLNDSVELQQLINDIDGFQDTTVSKNNDDDDDDDDDRPNVLTQLTEQMAKLTEQISNNGKKVEPIAVAEAGTLSEVETVAAVEVKEELPVENAVEITPEDLAVEALSSDASIEAILASDAEPKTDEALEAEARQIIQEMPALEKVSDETKEVAVKLYVAHIREEQTQMEQLAENGVGKRGTSEQLV